MPGMTKISPTPSYTAFLAVACAGGWRQSGKAAEWGVGRAGKSWGGEVQVQFCTYDQRVNPFSGMGAPLIGPTGDWTDW
jgi:hypothetical protein